jgi:hypothetical protein
MRKDARAAGSGLVPGRSGTAAAGQRRRVHRLEQRQVVHHVEGQQLQRTLFAVHRGVDQPVAAGLQRVLADDVVVGDEQARLASTRKPEPTEDWLSCVLSSVRTCSSSGRVRS